MNIILITGASSGIGREFAKQMDVCFGNIDEFWLIARSSEGLKETADSLCHKSRLLPMDITVQENLDSLEQELREENAIIRILVNCAGYGIMGAFSKQNRNTILGMIRLNCEALTDMTHRMIPYMRPNSRIIQMASCAAFLPQPNFAVYAATKSYVLSFSRALGEELKPFGIYVTSVCPGPVDTPFFDIAEENGSTLAIKKYTLVNAREVVSLALKDSYHRRSVSVCSLPIKAVRVLAKFLPHDMILAVMKHMK